MNRLVDLQIDFNRLMGNIAAALDCSNQSDVLKAKQIELDEAKERAELYKNEVERVKLLFERATGRPVEQGILKTSESFRYSTNLKDKVIHKNISFSLDHEISNCYEELESTSKEDLRTSGGSVKEAGNNDIIRNSLRRLFRPFPKKERNTNPTPPPTPSPPDGKFTNVNGN